MSGESKKLQAATVNSRIEKADLLTTVKKYSTNEFHAISSMNKGHAEQELYKIGSTVIPIKGIQVKTRGTTLWLFNVEVDGLSDWWINSNYNSYSKAVLFIKNFIGQYLRNEQRDQGTITKSILSQVPRLNFKNLKIIYHTVKTKLTEVTSSAVDKTFYDHRLNPLEVLCVSVALSKFKVTNERKRLAELEHRLHKEQEHYPNMRIRLEKCQAIAEQIMIQKQEDRNPNVE